MAKLSTHVLDTANGCPAEGMKIDFVRAPGAGEVLLKSVVTNSDGRTDELLLTGEEMVAGEYELRFNVRDYFAAQSGEHSSGPTFLNIVPIRFTITDPAQGYHVPLVCSPWSFSTYRGS
ncbi:MAG: hydroxyisourate hydrolase [Rhizobiaceae bacterium]